MVAMGVVKIMTKCKGCAPNSKTVHSLECSYKRALILIDELKEKLRAGLRPHRCPICGGKGQVTAGFYAQTSGSCTVSSAAFEECRSCEGSGLVWYEAS